MTETTIRFPAPAKYLNLNDRLHWAERNRRTQLWRHMAGIQARRQLGANRAHGPCLVSLAIPTDRPNHRRDPSNWTPTLKACIDGLVDAGVWPDDSGEWVGVLEPRFYKPDGPAADADVIVTLIPREPLT